MNDKQTLEKWYKKLNSDINHRTWLFQIGFIETHEILYNLEYNKWFKQNG